MNRTAILYALVSAALFGVSTSTAKVLVGSIQPAVLAGCRHPHGGRVWLHLTEHHEHEHIHAPMAHVHPQVHVGQNVHFQG